MFLSKVLIENFRCFGEGKNRFELDLGQGLTALVGENDAGKSAIIDALRLALGTKDQERLWLEDSDFYGEDTRRTIRITCVFDALSSQEKWRLVEFLSYPQTPSAAPTLTLTWTAKATKEPNSRTQRRVEVHSGKDGHGPSLPPEIQEFLRATYLRPLRDAERALSAGRGSRLSQVLQHFEQVRNSGGDFDPASKGTLDLAGLNVLGIGGLVDYLLEKQEGILEARKKINKHLMELSLSGDFRPTQIQVSGSKLLPETRLRQLLEKLELVIDVEGAPGLGSNNVLFMACELLLLGEEDDAFKLLLIEEPEGHLHAQRQLQVMRFLQEQAQAKSIQIIVTTHSPTLASAIKLDSIVLVKNARAFSLAEGETRLTGSDYRFLERFLDATKANLFFARGVMIVEGDAENILLPTLAELIDRNLTKHGVSVVNVGGIGLRRYARIFQREDAEKDGTIDIPVACITDLDIMPDCAPVIIGKVKVGEPWPSTRRWKARKDVGTQLEMEREDIVARASGQAVRTFVAEGWTLEYDLALGRKGENGRFNGGLAKDVFVAARLASNDARISDHSLPAETVEVTAIEAFEKIIGSAVDIDGCSEEEVVAAHVYAEFAREGVPKPVAAQYLAERLKQRTRNGELTNQELRQRLPIYLTDAIDYVTGS